MIASARNSSFQSHKGGFKVAVTSFGPKVAAVYEQYVKQLNGVFVGNLTYETNVLISGSVTSDKYRVYFLN